MFTQLFFGGACVCTNVDHSEDEVLLFENHFGLSMNNDVDPYFALFVLDAWGGWRGLVSSRHVRVLRWTCTSIKALSLDSHELVSELSMRTTSHYLC